MCLEKICVAHTLTEGNTQTHTLAFPTGLLPWLSTNTCHELNTAVAAAGPVFTTTETTPVATSSARHTATPSTPAASAVSSTGKGVSTGGPAVTAALMCLEALQLLAVTRTGLPPSDVQQLNGVGWAYALAAQQILGALVGAAAGSTGRKRGSQISVNEGAWWSAGGVSSRANEKAGSAAQTSLAGPVRCLVCGVLRLVETVLGALGVCQRSGEGEAETRARRRADTAVWCQQMGGLLGQLWEALPDGCEEGCAVRELLRSFM